MAIITSRNSAVVVSSLMMKGKGRQYYKVGRRNIDRRITAGNAGTGEINYLPVTALP